MADTTISAAMRAKQWDSKYHMEYVRTSRFKPFMGMTENSVIQVNEKLTKNKGDAITFNLIGALDAAAGPNDGSTALVGNEKALPNDGFRITVGVVRDAVVINVEEEQASPIDIREAAKASLMKLQQRYLKLDTIEALGSINGVAYGTASAGQKNTWHDSNEDRLLYGSEVGNFVANDHAASLANIDGTNDKLTGEVVSLAKRIAQGATTVNGDGITPISYGNNMETFVMFVHRYAFRDFRADMLANGYWQDALQRAKSNPIFSGMEAVEWDGVTVVSIPEIEVIAGAGAGTPAIDVAPCYLCGAQALGLAWAKRTKTTMRKEDDYEFQRGVGFMELRGLEKILYGQGTTGAKDWGMATVFVSGVADA